MEVPEPNGPVVRIENRKSDGFVEIYSTLTAVVLVTSDGTTEVAVVLSEESRDLIATNLFRITPPFPEHHEL